MTKNRIILGWIIIVLIMSFICSSCAFATGQSQLESEVELLNGGGDEAHAILKQIMSIMAWVGFMIAIFKVVQIGINFMVGIGSRRSDAKSSILPWFIGAVICATFGVVGPWFIGMIASSDSGNIFDDGGGTSIVEPETPDGPETDEPETPGGSENPDEEIDDGSDHPHEDYVGGDF